MAKKNYRVMFGDHMVPNPEYNPENDEPKSKYIAAPAGSVVTLEEERAVAFTKVLPGTPGGPKLVETTDQPRTEAFGKAPVAQVVPKPPA
jgi:hypothetical protein